MINNSMQKLNTKYLQAGRYEPCSHMFIYYEKGSNGFYADDNNDGTIEVCYGPCSGGADYWTLSIEHKAALLAIVDRHGFDTRKLLAYTRQHELNKKPEVKNGLGVKLSLVGKDGNAYSLLSLFRRTAKRQGFTDDQIDPIIKDAQSGDYSHLLCVLMDNCN